MTQASFRDTPRRRFLWARLLAPRPPHGKAEDRRALLTSRGVRICVDHLLAPPRAREATAAHKKTDAALLGAQPVSALGPPPVSDQMDPDGMPSASGMQCTHTVCVVRPGDRVWVRETMLTGCAD